MKLNRKLLKTLFVGWFLFLFWTWFTWVLNLSNNPESNFWIKNYKINLFQEVSASDDDEYEDEDNEYYEKVKENYYKNKINSSENLSVETNTSPVNEIGNNTQIKDQILTNFKFNNFYEKLTKIYLNQDDISLVLSKLSDNLYVIIDKLNLKIDWSINDENIKMKINSLQKIKDLVDSKLIEFGIEPNKLNEDISIDSILSNVLPDNRKISSSTSTSHQAPNWSIYTIIKAWNEYLFKRSNWTYGNIWFSTIEGVIAYIDKNAVPQLVTKEDVKQPVVNIPKKTIKKTQVIPTKKVVSEPKKVVSQQIIAPIIKPVVIQAPKPVISVPKKVPKVNTTTRAS